MCLSHRFEWGGWSAIEDWVASEARCGLFVMICASRESEIHTHFTLCYDPPPQRKVGELRMSVQAAGIVNAGSRPVAVWAYALLALPVLAAFSTYPAHVNDFQVWNFKGTHEPLALTLLGPAAVAFALHALVGRDRLRLLLALLAVAFYCREWHFAGTSKGVYVALGLLGVWGWAWRRFLMDTLADRRLLLPLVATGWAYLLSQLIARRVFRFVPLEDVLHVPAEEVTETMAHTMLAGVAIAGLIGWVRHSRAAATAG